MNIMGIRDLRLIVIFLIVLIIFLGNIPNISANIDNDAKNNTNIKEIAEEPTEISYIVNKGDSLSKIANKHKVSIYQLREWNNLNQNSILQPGQEVLIRKIEYIPTEGLASWYGPGFHGKNMANGQVYNMYDIVVAHRTLPLGLSVKVTNLENGRSIIAPVLDRGPYVKNYKGEYTREIDLSYKIALELGTVKKGVVPVKVEPLNEPLLKN